MEFNDVRNGIYVTTHLKVLNKLSHKLGSNKSLEEGFPNGCVFLNKILIQILRFAYFLVTNSKGEKFVSWAL